MVWFKVDDALATHEKVLMAGNAAMGLWVRAGAWSAQHLTDGVIPTHTVRLLGNLAQANALVKAGLWLKEDGGFRFHGWMEYQPTKAHVESVREARRQAGMLGGRPSKSKQDESNAEAKCLDGAFAMQNPRPVPVPTLSVVANPSQSSKSPRELNADGLTRIQQALNGCPESHARKTADFVLAKAPSDVRSPVGYILAAIKDDPAAYRYRRGNPKRTEECEVHAGEWADACRGCAIDRKVADA